MAASGVSLSEEQWIRGQLRVLENHHYFTDAAQRLRGEGKHKNIIAMGERLAGITAQATEEGGTDDRSR
jgi:hypothetical protein